MTIRRTRRHLPILLPLGVLAWIPGCEPVERREVPRRAIVVSIDALNEGILRRTLDPAVVPTFLRVLDEGACADHAVTAFPSSTAPSHAVLWTGAYGNVSGATSNSQHRLPRSRHTVLESISGFLHHVLDAEAIWISAGREGIPVAGHHVTQGPGVPGHPAVDRDRTREQEARREEARRILAREGVDVLRGYLWTLEPHRVLTADDVEWTDPAEWQGLEAFGEGVPPRSFRWETGAGTFHGVLHGGDAYEAVTVASDPDRRAGVTAYLRPPEDAPPEDRELARHFSPALEVPVQAGSLEEGRPQEGRVHLRVRLFHVDEDGGDFVLYHPALHPVAGNTPELMEAYDRAVGGWLGNSAMWVYRDGGFGPTLMEGGDGTAEARYLETAELLLRQFMQGSEWMWQEREPRLMLDYFPLSDTVDHELLGFLEPEWPGFDRELAQAVADFRNRAWRLVELRLAHLVELARGGDAALFLTGDHGMRVSWNLFLPNLALRDAGLLVLDADGNVDLSRTRAVSPNGYWVSVNRTAWRGGIVPPEEEAEVVDAVRTALEGVVDGRGVKVVPRTFTPEESPELGIGGPAGGDVYWATAPTYRSSSGLRGEAPAVAVPVTAGHGFPPDEPDMFTVFCGMGPGLAGGVRVGSVRTTVVAPTVAEYTGIPAPADATGASILARMMTGGAGDR
jgi:predicted AlkP superfamily phosphohydrolase/phosphomutase